MLLLAGPLISGLSSLVYELNPTVAGSSRQGCNPAGGSPAMIIVRFGHVAIPQKVTSSPLRGVNALAARRTSSLRAPTFGAL
jgi:hypothetical protein